MNEQQRDELIELISGDCSVRNRLINFFTGETCVVGAMLKCVGIPEAQLKDYSTSTPGVYPVEWLQKLEEHFGLSIEQIRWYIISNDGNANLNDRRQVLIGLTARIYDLA